MSAPGGRSDEAGERRCAVPLEHMRVFPSAFGCYSVAVFSVFFFFLFCGIKRLRCVLYVSVYDSSVLPSWLLGRPPDPSSVEPLLLSTVDRTFPGTRL